MHFLRFLFLLILFSVYSAHASDKTLMEISGKPLLDLYQINIYPESNKESAIKTDGETLKFNRQSEKDHIVTPFYSIPSGYNKRIYIELKNKTGGMCFYLQDENYNNIFRDVEFSGCYKNALTIPSNTKKIRLLFSEPPAGYSAVELPYSIKIKCVWTYNYVFWIFAALTSIAVIFFSVKTLEHIRKDGFKISVSGKIILAILFTIILILICELFGRYVLNMQTWTEQRPFIPYFGHGELLRSNEKVVSVLDRDYGYVDEYGYFYNSFQNDSDLSVNSLGKHFFDHYLSRYSMKETDYLINKNPDAIKIFVIGGSVAQGTSATEPSKTWHCLLEKKLRSFFKRDDIYVFNVAMGGFISTQERIVYDLIISPRKHDIVIDVTMFNDMNNPIYYSVLPGHPYMTSIRYMELYGNSFIKLLSNNSVFFWHFYKKNYENFIINQRKKVVSDKKKLAFITKSTQNIFWENIFHMASCSNNNKAEFLLFIQPSIYYTEYILNLPPLDKIAFYDKNTGKILIDIYKETELKIEKINTQNFKFYSLMKIIDDKNKIILYSDIAHFNNEGQFLLTEKIFPPVKEAVERTILKAKLK